MKILETERLVLRRLTAGDAAFILELLNEPAFLENIGDRGARTLADARRYIARGPVASYRKFGFGLYLVELKDSGTPVGICGLLKRESLEDVDIGFAFLRRYWSQGYARESAAAVMHYGWTELAPPAHRRHHQAHQSSLHRPARKTRPALREKHRAAEPRRRKQTLRCQFSAKSSPSNL